MLRTTVLLLALSLLGGCGGGGSNSDDSPSSGDWRNDIDFLARQMERIHPNLFHSIDRNQYQAAVDSLKAKLPGLSFAEIVTGIHRLVALAAAQEDGHSQVTMFQATGFRLYPLRLYEFADGLFIIDATAPYQFAIGQQVVQIGGKNLDQVNALLDPLIPRDNSNDVKRKRTLYYIVAEILQASGIVANTAAAEFMLDDGGGNLTNIVLAPIDKEIYRNTLSDTIGLPQRALPITLSDIVTPFWMQHLAADNALYIKYNWVFSTDGSGLTMTQFSHQIAASVDLDKPQKVIVDMRHNRGGDNTTSGPLLNVLSRPTINQAGKLYVIIGRGTFSAAANFVTQLDLGTNVRFAGEATGGSLNNFGDAVSFKLPRSRLEIWVPTFYWIYAPGNPRIAIAPEIAVEWTSADYFSQQDPVLQAVLDD